MGPILNFLLQRSRERLNAVTWQQRRTALRNMPGTYLRRGHKIPLEGRPRRPGVDPAGTYVSLPMHEKDEPFSFFFREGVSATTRHKIGKTGVQKDVARPTVQRQGTANLKAAKAYSPVQRHGRRFPSGGTDQKSFSGRRGGLPNWDGQVRAGKTKPSWQTAKPHGGPVPESCYRDPYNFLI